MRTREKRHRMKKRIIRRIVWRTGICLIGILILAAAWKTASFAFRLLKPSSDSKQEEAEDSGLLYRTAESFGEEADEALSNSAVSKEDILLVNKSHPLKDTYDPSLIKHRAYGVEVDTSIYDALNQMLAAGEKEGLHFWIASGYRSTERQRELLDEDIGTLVRQGYSYSEAYEEVVKETMPVGCSEHATGLAVDIVSKDYQILDEKQADTAEIKWLQKNCSQYGFILRYPKDKEDITLVSYESWHFRYVGVDAAKEIMSRGITLEEYLEED